MNLILALIIAVATFVATFIFDFIEAAYSSNGDDEEDAEYVMTMFKRDLNVAVVVFIVASITLWWS